MADKLRALITGVLAIEPDQPAIEFEKRWSTYGQLASGMAQLDSILRTKGLEAGARVGVLLRNRTPYVPAILEVVTSDRCLVTLNPVYPDDRVASDIVKSAAPVIVAMSDDWARPQLREAAAQVGAVGVEATIEPDGALSFQELFAGDPARWTQPRAQGIAIEMLTSGTTGPPKRVPLAAETFEKSMLDFALYEKGRDTSEPRLRSGTSVLLAPLAHIGGIGGVINVISSGRKFCLLEKFSVPAFHDAVVRHRPKVTGGPPTIMRMLLDANVPRKDLSSIVAFRSGTAPLDPALAAEFQARYGIPVLQNYGATEFAGGVAGWTNDDYKAFGDRKIGSVGRLNPGIEGRIVDPESGAEAPGGETGVLELKAKHLGDGGWVRTTDLAVLDADGFLFIRGRADNAINRGGLKVSPDEVVRALEAHPSVAEASVVGLSDPRLGQVPVAALRARPGVQQPSDGELSGFLRQTLSSYQVPVLYRWVDTFPRTVSLKIDQAEVRSLFAAVDAPSP
jgi:acyl-CoA synthetase (AMP-forming)/AMP-acid ligase II